MSEVKEIKKLGFGLMRLPKKDDQIDIEHTKKMVDHFLEAGFTYFDTAWAYTGSEDAIRQALVERYPREQFQLATKNSAWMNCKTKEDAIEQFETSLKQTGAGYFDYYLLHNLGDERTEPFEKFNLWEWILDMKAQGKIKHAGFSFHSTPEQLDELLTKHPEMEFVQLQINYADWNDPTIQSRKCYEVARKHGKQIIVMEPVRGGLLANPPEQVQKVLKEANPEASFASWAIKFAANLDGVLTVLSGMSNIEQMDDNISYMKTFEKLTEEEEATLRKVEEIIKDIPIIPCTTCNYCAKVCPMNIGISGSFTAMNLWILYNDEKAAQAKQRWLVDRPGLKRAKECIKCGKCEKACPQHIAIRDELSRVDEALGE